jgi:tRNA threonylcarbamoyladenosine modification (KEOPS) complex  Pcc1 subunit
MLKKILFLSILFFSIATSANAQMKFLPEKCDGVIVINPVKIFDGSLLKDGIERKKLNKIISEISKLTGVDILSSERIGVYITNFGKFITGDRPRITIFVRGDINKDRVISASKSQSPSSLSGFKIYPVGGGTGFSFIKDRVLLFGELDGILAGMMANKKEAMSSYKEYSSLIKSTSSSTFILALSLRFDSKTITSLKSIIGNDIPLHPLLDGLTKLELVFDENKGLFIKFHSSTDGYGTKNKETISLLKKMADSILKRTQIKGEPSLTAKIFNSLKLKIRKNSLIMRVPAEELSTLKSDILSSFLKIFARNYMVAEGTSDEKRCITNMKIIEGAAELCFLDGKVKTRKDVTMKMLVDESYLRKLPKCPNGGTYKINAVKNGFSIECTKHGELDEIYDKLYNPKRMK